MALLMPARRLPACLKLLPKSPALTGMVRGSLACGRPPTGTAPMAAEKLLRCAIYTRKSTEHGLEQEFNSLHAQRDACEAYIKSQASQGWRALPQHYDDPAYSGGNLDGHKDKWFPGEHAAIVDRKTFDQVQQLLASNPTAEKPAEPRVRPS